MSAAVAAAAALFLLIPAARGNADGVTWSAATPTTGTQYGVPIGSYVVFTLGASSSTPVSIRPVGALPAGAKFRHTDGQQAKATFRWTPKKQGVTVRVRFSATTADGASATPVAYTIKVGGPRIRYPHLYKLATPKIAHWAVVESKTKVRARPSRSSRVVTTLGTMTGDGTQNLVLILDGMDITPKKTWYRVRLPILPNNTTGWVEATALGDLYPVRSHLYVNRATTTATLKIGGKVVFKTRVGIGRKEFPTPAGEFYVRDKLTDFADPFYGPVAFGTSARSPTLTDWPGGGFVGVHGTNNPQILPGRVSHGCIRMRNSAILRLEKLMPVGTPMTIT